MKTTSYKTCELTCTTAQVALFTICLATEQVIARAEQSQAVALSTWIAKTYGSKSPSFDQYKSDLAALSVLAAERHLVTPDYVWRAYRNAIKTTFGSLPESKSPEAIRKAAARAATAKAKPAAEKVGAKKDVVQEKPANAQETIAQCIAREGVHAVLAELVKILAAEKSTALYAKTLAGVSAQLTGSN